MKTPPLRILVVGATEDETPAYGEILGGSRRAARVLEVASDRDAVILCESDAPDCIIVDHCPPLKDGLTLLQELRSRALDVPVLLLSDQLNPQTPATSPTLGAVGVLSRKRANPVSIRRVVARLLKHAKDLRSRRYKKRAIRTGAERSSARESNEETMKAGKAVEDQERRPRAPR